MKAINDLINEKQWYNTDLSKKFPSKFDDLKKVGADNLIQYLDDKGDDGHVDMQELLDILLAVYKDLKK